MGIVDNYGYGPLVRQVYAQRVFAPAEGEAPDEAEIAQGLATARMVLGALERIAAEGKALGYAGVTLADLHLAPMIAAFTRAPEGAEMLEAYPALARWWKSMAQRESLAATDPGLP